MAGTPHILPRGYGVLVIRSTMAGFPLLPWLPWKSRLDPLCPMPCAPVANIQKWDPGTRSTLTHMHSILPPATCHAMAHLARMVARTALPCAVCTRTPSSLPSHTASVQYSVVSGRRPFLMSGAGPVDVPAPLPAMHRRLGLLSGSPAAAAASSRSALIAPPVNLV
jgi:hypothetical protein